MQPVKTTNDKAIQFWNKCVCALPQKTVGAQKKKSASHADSLKI